jgi:hypothetical protein
MHEQEPGLDLILVPAAVDGSGDLVLHTVPPTLVRALTRRGNKSLPKLSPVIALLLRPNCN